MAQKMTNENKPFVMSTLSGVAYKDLEEARETFNYWRFTEHKFIDRDGAQCYLIWNDDDAVVIFRGTEPKQWSDVKADLNAFKRRGRYKHDMCMVDFKVNWIRYGMIWILNSVC